MYKMQTYSPHLRISTDEHSKTVHNRFACHITI